MSDNEFVYNYLFPSLVVYNDFGKVSEDLIDFSKQLLQDYGDKPFNAPCLSTLGAHSTILNLPEFGTIKEHIIKTLSVFSDIHQIDKNDMYFTESWLNSYDTHGYQDLHLHPESMVSGIFYIKSEGEKDLIFQSPYHFHQPVIPKYTKQNLSNCHTAEYASVEGRCIIFMSHLMHRTLPATKERISLSFNIKYKNV